MRPAGCFSSSCTKLVESSCNYLSSGSEIYITHRGLSEEYEDSKKDHTVWRGRPSDPTLEAEMLSRLMAKLGAPKDAVAAVKNDKPSAAATAANSLAHMNADGLSMMVDADFDTAWRRVGLALDRSGFTVENRDRKQGAYEVRLSDNDPDASKPGFFARMFGAKATSVDGLSRYRVLVQNNGKSSLVSVSWLDRSGATQTIQLHSSIVGLAPIYSAALSLPPQDKTLALRRQLEAVDAGGA